MDNEIIDNLTIKIDDLQRENKKLREVIIILRSGINSTWDSLNTLWNECEENINKLDL